MRLECWCSAGAHSLGRHERNCPITAGYAWCEDCSRRWCICQPVITPIDPDAPDVWALPETRTA